jgi:hypothetical protein
VIKGEIEPKRKRPGKIAQSVMLLVFSACVITAFYVHSNNMPVYTPGALLQILIGELGVLYVMLVLRRESLLTTVVLCATVLVCAFLFPPFKAPLRTGHGR